MAAEPVHSKPPERRLELSVDELLRRARPLPSHEEMTIKDLTAEEGQAFLVAVSS